MMQEFVASNIVDIIFVIGVAMTAFAIIADELIKWIKKSY